jgi:hypothetical protein
MSRTAFTTAVLFGLASTAFASIAFVKASHNFPSHRAVMAESYAANRCSTVPSDHVALLIANSSYPDAEIPLLEVAAGADLPANACITMVLSLTSFVTRPPRELRKPSTG